MKDDEITLATLLALMTGADAEDKIFDEVNDEGVTMQVFHRSTDADLAIFSFTPSGNATTVILTEDKVVQLFHALQAHLRDKGVRTLKGVK